MQRQLDDAEAHDLRQMVAEVSDAADARIRGDAAAVERLRRATQKLQIAGMGPFEYWTSQVWQPLKNICLVMAQELSVLPTINDHDGEITAAEVARQNGSDELLIGVFTCPKSTAGNISLSPAIVRLMRVLTSVGIAEETGPNTYKANGLSKLAASEGGKAGIKFTNELLFQVAAKVVPYIRDHGFKQFPQRPHEMDLVQYTFGGRTMFDYLKDDPETKYWFDTLMAENRKGNRPWYEIYPFAEQLGKVGSTRSDEVLVVDVGGNRGADILEVRRAFPDLPGRFILQDLPETIEAIDKSTMDGVELQPYDFFTPQLVKGAKAYFWRWVLHDFDDASVRKFLPNTVEAMTEDSRLLLMELVLPDIGTDVKCSHLDILMMLYHSGMERSLAQWRALLESCGLELVKVWSRPDTDPSILECKLKSS